MEYLISTKMQHPESKLQQTCVRWFRLQYPKIARCLFAIPNGGRRSKIEAAIMQAEGVTPGVSDLFLMVPTGFYHGMFIEMKAGKGKLSDAQADFLFLADQQKYAVAVCYSLDEFMKSVEGYLKDESEKRYKNHRVQTNLCLL